MKEPTLRQYVRGAVELLQALGEDVGQWTAQAVRNFLLERASRCGAPTTQKLITSLRAFLRYLNFRGESRDDLALAIPAVAHWRLSRLPQCLSAEDVERLIAACDGPHLGRLRDGAIVLMLARLGLRSGDVAHLHLADIDCQAEQVARTIFDDAHSAPEQFATANVVVRTQCKPGNKVRCGRPPRHVSAYLAERRQGVLFQAGDLSNVNAEQFVGFRTQIESGIRMAHFLSSFFPGPISFPVGGQRFFGWIAARLEFTEHCFDLQTTRCWLGPVADLRRVVSSK